jgi:hypothetical protein
MSSRYAFLGMRWPLKTVGVDTLAEEMGGAKSYHTTVTNNNRRAEVKRRRQLNAS